MRLEDQYPKIPWDEPLKITVPGVGAGLACRRCVARYGFEARNVAKLHKTKDDFTQHLAEFHKED